jgi:hypothetical protein
MNKSKWMTALVVMAVAMAVSTSIFWRMRHPARTPIEKLQQVHSATWRHYGTNAIPVTDTNSLLSFIHEQPVTKSTNGEITLDSLQRQQLSEAIVEFLVTYSKADFDAIVQFHSKDSFHVAPGATEPDQDLLADLAIEGLQVPRTPMENARAIWEMANHRAYRFEFWTRHLERLKAKGAPLPTNSDAVAKMQEGLLPEYRKSLEKIPFPYERIRFTGISTNGFGLLAMRVRSAPSMTRLISENMKMFRGSQMVHLKILAYDIGPEQLTAAGGECLYAIALMGVHTNSKAMITPIGIGFYWVPGLQKWLMDAFIEHSAGGLGIVL